MVLVALIDVRAEDNCCSDLGLVKVMLNHFEQRVKTLEAESKSNKQVCVIGKSFGLDTAR